MFRHLQFVLTISMVASILAFTIGCGSSSKTTSSQNNVSVMATVPAAGATGVNTTAAIQISFSGAVNPATVNSTNIQVTDASKNAVAGTVSYNATTNTASFAPTAPLAANSTFTVTVSSVAGASGGVMATPFTDTFTTAAAPTAATQYQESLFGGYNTTNGQVSVDTSGNVTVQLTGATASTTFSVQFCPNYEVDTTQPACIPVGSVTTDSSGNGTATTTFPDPGAWAGQFQVSSANSGYSTQLAGNFNAETFMATLVPLITVNGGILGYESQGPLQSGTVTYSNGSFTIVINGGSINTGYSVTESGIPLGTSESFELSDSQGNTTFTTDANGNVTFNVLADGYGGDMIEVYEDTSSGAGFIGGFGVPAPK
jgi:Big-like domain-containing protein